MQKALYYVYIMECSDGSFYIGITTDLTKRLRMHNGEINGGAKYTRVRRPIILRYNETCTNRSEATKREIALKKLTHSQKSSLCDACTCRISYDNI